MIQGYFSQIKTTLILSSAVSSYIVVSEVVKDLEGYIRILTTLEVGGKLEFFIYLTYDEKLQVEKYSFHWQDSDGNLIKRWDNAPHHSHLDTFPHHLHQDDSVKPATEPTLKDVLEIIKKESII